MISTASAIATLFALAATVWPVPSLSVACRRTDHAAPLSDACLYPGEFRARYGLYLRPESEQMSYRLIDGRRNTLALKLTFCDTDSAVLAALLSGDAQVGILGTDEVLGAVLKGRPVRIVAPLEHGGDFLLANQSVPASDWQAFVAWVKARTEPTTVGYTGQYSTAALAFAQALGHEKIACTMQVPGTSIRSESARVRLVQADNRLALARDLAAGGLDAALLEEPDAARASARGCRRIARTDILPPGRFEDHPATVVAAADSTIHAHGEDVGRFLELLAVATHYANNHTRNTLAAACRWLTTSPALESISLGTMRFSSRPDVAFTTGIWNWYFALRLRNAVPRSMAGFMEEKDWLGVPYDSLLLMPALDRAGARIIR